MKGTRLWQGPGSPLIQGRSRQIRPLWQPWLVGFTLSMILANWAAWYLYQAFPPEFFFVASAAGSLAGAWFSRAMGWKARWVLGTAVALVVDAAVFALLVRFAPTLMWHL